MSRRGLHASPSHEGSSTDRRSLRDVRAAFDAVVDKSHAERVLELDRVCRGHPELRRELEALLAAADRTPDPTALPVPRSSREPTDRTPPAIAGFGPLVPIGRGGMGEVFAARRLHDAREVAIKIPHRDRELDDQRRARFDREAMILSRLDHPGIVRLLGRGSHRGLPYLVLELVRDGVPIDRFAARDDAPLEQVLALAHAVADSIAHAHALGFVHRDLKPANVLVDRDGRPHLLDFGIAKVEHRDLEATILHTGAEQVLGSLEAMSPEQTRVVDAPVDARSDIYQLGLVLHRLACPAALPPKGHLAALTRLRAISRSVRVARLDGDPRLTRPLRGVLHAALRSHPEDRYQRMRDFADDLRAILHGRLTRPNAPGPWHRAIARTRRLVGSARRRA